MYEATWGKKWSLGHCTRPLGRWSYEVEVEGRRYRRNCRQVQSTLESSPVPSCPTDEPHQAENESKLPVVPEFLSEHTDTQAPEIEVNDAIFPTQSVPRQCRSHPSFPAQTF